MRAEEQNRPDVARHRQRWRVWQRYMDPARFVFLDETWASTNMVRRYGWGLKGKRLVDAAPYGHWRTTPFVAGLRASGIIVAGLGELKPSAEAAPRRGVFGWNAL